MNILYKYIFPLLTILIIGLIGFLIYTFAIGNDDTVNDNTETSTNTTSQDSNDTADSIESEEDITPDRDSDTKLFTREDVAAANTISNCLFIYESSVYAIPSTWANEHPGGRTEITSNCGKDVTQLFNVNHRGKTEPQEQLQEFYAGELSN